MDKITDEVIDRVKKANPGTNVYHCEHDKLPVECIVRAPSVQEWDIFNNLQTEKKFSEANEMLVQSCVLYPDKDGLAKQIAEHPALRETWSAEICEVAGITSKVKRKKL